MHVWYVSANVRLDLWKMSTNEIIFREESNVGVVIGDELESAFECILIKRIILTLLGYSLSLKLPHCL